MRTVAVSLSLLGGILVLVAPAQAEQGDGRDAEAVIRGLYQDHQPWRKKSVDLGDRKALGKYFEPELVELLVRDDECARRTREICRLDFDPFLSGQDYDDAGITGLTVRPLPDAGPDSYQVTFKNIEDVSLVYRVRRTTRGWRVADIVYPGGDSLKTLLSKPLRR